MKQASLFALATLAIALLGATVLGKIFTEPRATAALWTSAALAVLVQVGTFVIARRYALRGDVIKGWGIGALMRVAALALYGVAFFGPRGLGLPLAPALLSFALFVFVSTVFEPLFLPR